MKFLVVCLLLLNLIYFAFSATTADSVYTITVFDEEDCFTEGGEIVAIINSEQDICVLPYRGDSDETDTDFDAFGYLQYFSNGTLVYGCQTGKTSTSEDDTTSDKACSDSANCQFSASGFKLGSCTQFTESTATFDDRWFVIDLASTQNGGKATLELFTDDNCGDTSGTKIDSLDASLGECVTTTDSSKTYSAVAFLTYTETATGEGDYYDTFLVVFCTDEDDCRNKKDDTDASCETISVDRYHYFDTDIIDDKLNGCVLGFFGDTYSVRVSSGLSYSLSTFLLFALFALFI